MNLENEDDQPDAEGAQREDGEAPKDDREKPQLPTSTLEPASLANSGRRFEPARLARLRQERRISARQVLGEPLEEFEASHELRLVHELIRLVGHIDRTWAADDGRQARRLEMAGFGGERDGDGLLARVSLSASVSASGARVGSERGNIDLDRGRDRRARDEARQPRQRDVVDERLNLRERRGGRRRPAGRETPN